MNVENITPQGLMAKIVFFLRSRMPRFLLLAIVILIVMLAGEIKKENALIAADKTSGQDRLPAEAVALTLTPGTIYDRINLPGNIQPWTALTLHSTLNGKVEKILVKEGQKVKKGDVLATIEGRDCQALVDQAPAAGKPAGWNANGQPISSKGEIDAGNSLPATSEADLDNAELQESRCTVIAPTNGVVRQLQAKVGQQLSIAAPFAELLEIDRVKAIVGIPEVDVTAVRGLTTVNVALQSLGDRVITGKVHFLSAAPETADRLFRLELAIDNSGGDILPGMPVRAEVVRRVVENAIVIPFYSVVSLNNAQYVYVENDGEVEKRPVKLGIVDKWRVEVREGLAAGDHLLVEGTRDIEDKQKGEVKAGPDTKERTL